MNNIKINNLSHDNKTVGDWLTQTRAQSHYFRNKYEASYEIRSTPSSILSFYRHTSDKYFELTSLLYHLNNYGKLIDGERCHCCKNDWTHRQLLRSLYVKYYKLIMRCRDGYRFGSNKINIAN